MLRQRFWVCVAVVALAATAPSRAADPRYLPSEAEVILSINIKQLLNSELVKAQKPFLDQIKTQLENKVKEDDNAAKFLQKIGFDPLKDLDSLTVAHPGTKDPQAAFLVIEGKFDFDKVTSTADEAAKDQPASFRILKGGKTPVYEISAPNGRIFVAMVQGKALLVSMDQDVLQASLAQAAGSRASGMKKEIKELVTLASTGETFSFLISTKAIEGLMNNARIPNADQATKMVEQFAKQVTGVTVSLTVAKDIQFQLGIAATDEQTAKGLVGLANFGMISVKTGLAKQAKEEPEKFKAVEDVVNTIRITNQGNNAVLRADVSYSNLEALIKNAPRFKQ